MAIDHFVTELSAERKAAIDDFLSEEQRIHGLLSDIRQTLEIGRGFILSADALMGQFNASGLSGKAMTFDITDYRMTLAELSNSARELTNLLTSVERFNANISADQLIPQVITTIHKVEKQGKGLVDYIMRWVIVAIVIWFLGDLAAKVILQIVAKKFPA